ncbi:zinc ribbon domain-containing protein [Haloquadratum walsbyi]
MSYKTSWNGIPTYKLNPEYTSQERPCCGHL